MLLVIGIFFVIFLGAVVVLSLGRTGALKEEEKTLAVLQAALATEVVPSNDILLDIRKVELLSALPWLNRFLLRLEFAPRIRLLIAQANLKWTAGSLLMMSAACFVVPAYAVYLRTATFGPAFLVGAACAFGPYLYVRFKRAQRFGKFEQELPQSLDLMVSALRAGHSLVSALEIAAKESPDPVGYEFRICFEEQNYGLELKTAMNNLAARMPIHDLRVVITAILIQRETGGNLAEVLDKAAHLIRERFRLRRQVKVHTAQGRLTGWILSLLPPVLGFALYMVNPDTMRLLWTRPLGVKLLYASVVMTIAGGLIIRKIVNLEV